MGFSGDKKLIWTKNKFERFLNSIESDKWWLSIDYNMMLIVNNYPNSKYRDRIGSILRIHLKEEFERQYYIWLNIQ